MRICQDCDAHRVYSNKVKALYLLVPQIGGKVQGRAPIWRELLFRVLPDGMMFPTANSITFATAAALYTLVGAAGGALYHIPRQCLLEPGGCRSLSALQPPAVSSREIPLHCREREATPAVTRRKAGT